MNILIAEDNLLLHKLHGEFMNNWGYHFDIASNGLEAVKLAQENKGKYDLCLMDVVMPKMDGIEATKIIRRTVKFFPIIAYSSNGNYRKACYEAGMDNPGQRAINSNIRNNCSLTRVLLIVSTVLHIECVSSADVWWDIYTQPRYIFASAKSSEGLIFKADAIRRILRSEIFLSPRSIEPM